MKFLIILLIFFHCCVGLSSSDPFQCLQGALSNVTLYQADSPEYARAISIDNVRVVQRPLAVILPTSESQVSQAILAAQLCGVQLSVENGGHSAAGYCLNTDGLVVDLRLLSTIELLPDGQTLRVQAGAKWAEIYSAVRALTGDTLLPVGGGCPTVGASGFLLGGGWSFLSRSYGLGCDNVVAARVILANGTLIEASSSSSSSSDLFWALQGGGGGNFGIVTQFDLQLQKPLTSTGLDLMLVGEICWPPFDPRVRTMLNYWASEFYYQIPDWFLAEPVWLPIDRGQKMFCFTIICNHDPEDCMPVVAPLLAYDPPYNTLANESFVAWQLQNVNLTDAQQGYLYLTSATMLPGDLNPLVIDVLIDALRVAPSPRNLVLFHTAGGKINAVPANATAFPHRDLQVVLQIKAIWDNPSDEQINVEWVKTTRFILSEFFSGSYINYIDPFLRNWQTAYYLDNYPRLLEIKKSVDPSNFFHFNQSIGSTYP